MGEFKHIGIMGGTFDPVHIGHLILAELAICELSLDHVLFLPTGDPPHKKNRQLTSAQKRLDMLQLALEGNPSFSISTIELKRQGTTYSYDSLLELKGLYPDGTRLTYIIGSDTLLELKNWKSFNLVASLCDFAVYERPGIDRSDLRAEADRLEASYQAKVCFIKGPVISLSSSEIRQRVAHNKTIRYLVPERVFKYINKERLYRGESSNDKV